MYLASLVLVVACGDALPRTSLIPNQVQATPEVRDACRITEMKCSRCHTLGRIIAFDATTRADWEPIVTRMRRMVSSGITEADTEIVLRCLGDARPMTFKQRPAREDDAARAVLEQSSGTGPSKPANEAPPPPPPTEAPVEPTITETAR